MSVFSTRAAITAVAVLIGFDASAAKDLEGNWNLSWQTAPPRHVITINVVEEDVPVDDPSILLSVGSPLSRSSYRLLGSKGTTQSEVRITEVFATGREGNKALAIHVVPEGDLDSSFDYKLEIAKDKLAIVDAGDKLLPAQELDLLSEQLEMDQSFVQSRTLDNKIRVAGGTGGGTSSILFSQGLERFDLAENGSRRLLVRLDGQADFNFQSDKRDDYFNELEAELSFIYPQRTTFFGLLETERYLELGLGGRVDSDQKFENADASAFAKVAIYTKDPISTWIARRWGAQFDTQAVVSPLIVAEYSFVNEIASDSGSTTRDKPDTEGGEHRIQTSFDWSLPLVRDFDATALPQLGAHYDVDLLFRFTGIYDFKESDFFDTTRLGLELSPTTSGVVRPSIVFWWERGQAPPVFQSFDALMAGLRLAF